MSIIYGKLGGANNAAIGKIDTPIKMVIQNESNLCEKNKSILKGLFNIEKSKKFGETILGMSDFDTFMAVEEGQGAENDNIHETYKKFIEHVQFMKEFTITAEMMEDANFGVAADAKRRAENFTRAYYKTQNKLGSFALINGTSTSAIFNRARIDLTTGDNLPLFHNAHPYHLDKLSGQTQSNYFYGKLTESEAAFATSLSVLSNKIRNFRDENGEVMGYTADTIVLPGNRPILEDIAKKACGSERVAGSNNNDINTQYGNWTIVVLPDWQTTDDRFMVMSSDANKNLAGNMFFNRIPLTVNSWVDNHTGNYIWNGRCRFGVGFGTWKHIALAVNSSTAVSGATELK
jgi:hypothetical protein